MTGEQMQILYSVDQKVTQLLDYMEDHETRVRKLETFRTWAAGVGSAVSALFGYLFYASHN